jgi:ribosomal subunit interface protein
MRWWGREEALDLVLKGRGIRITDQIRKVAEHKLNKLGRIDPRVTRLKVEVIGERNPRIDGSHRVEVTCDTPRHVFRAQGSGHDVDSALDQVSSKLERQFSSYRGKLRDRRHA